MKFATLFLTAVSIPSLLHIAWGFDDLRSKPCRAPATDLKDIPPTEVEWDGDISLRLVCEPGYDHPHNFNPEQSTDAITCKGDTNRWQPDFIPDCNREIKSKAGGKCPDGTALVKITKGYRCRGCPIGQYMDAKQGGPVCKPCAKGYYQDTPMSSSCKICPSLEHNSANEAWDKVKRLTKDRLYHILGCPLVKKLANGTHVVFASQDEYAKEMDHVFRSRDELKRRFIKTAGPNSANNIMMDKWKLFQIFVLGVLSLKA